MITGFYGVHTTLHLFGGCGELGIRRFAISNVLWFLCFMQSLSVMPPFAHAYIRFLKKGVPKIGPIGKIRFTIHVYRYFY